MTESNLLGNAWSDVLPRSHREALSNAFHSLCDGFFQDMELMADGDVPFADSVLGQLLPARFKQRYTVGFARRFFLSFTTVGWKLAQPDRAVAAPSCVAEELALRILIDDAKSWLRDYADVEPDFTAFEDVVLQDADIEWLYELAHDGIEDTEAAEQLGIGHLHFDEWFKPFLNATTTVHPYSAEP